MEASFLPSVNLSFDSKLAISCYACFKASSGNSVAMLRGPVGRAAKVSCFMPDVRCDRYASLLVSVELATVTKTKSVRCSKVLAIAWVIPELKSRRNCNSSAAPETLVEDLPLLSSNLMAFNCDLILSCTLFRHLLNAAAWLHIVDASRAAFSQRRRLS